MTLTTACGLPELTLGEIEPSSGPAAGGTIVDLRGSGFDDDLVVRFGDEVATDVEVFSGSFARAETPPGSGGGAVDVTIESKSRKALLPGAFTYLAAPQISGVEPTWGPVEGGTAVIISGAGFMEGATVTFRGAPATGVTVMDAESIQARTPPAPPGLADVVVENPDGQTATLREGFEFRENIPCAVVETTPGFDGIDVDITSTLSITWDRPVGDAATDSVTLRELGGAEIHIDVEPSSDRRVTVTPAHPLRFWASYALTIGEFTALDEWTCAPEAVAFSTVEPVAAPRTLRPAAAVSMARDGDILFTVSGSYRGVQAWDVSDTTSPRLISDFATPWEPEDIAVAGGRAYVPVGFDGVLILDVSDPTAIAMLGVAGTPGYASQALPFSDGGTTFIAVADREEGVRLIDVTDPMADLEVAVIDPSGARAADVRRLDLEGHLLAIADGNNGYALADIASVEEPSLIGQGANGRETVDVAIRGDYIYLAQKPMRFSVADATDPALTLTEELRGSHERLESFRRIEMVGDTAFVAAWRGGVVTFTVDGAGGASRAEARFVPGYAYDLELISGNLVVGDESGVVTLQSSGSAEPLFYDDTGHGVVRGVSAHDDRLYGAASMLGLQVFSLSDAEAPALMTLAATPASSSHDYDVAAHSVLATDDLLIVGDGRAGIALFDSVASDEPSLLSSLDLPDRIRGMARADERVFACADNAGVVVVDISTPDTPALIAQETFPEAEPELKDQCYDLALAGNYLYVAGRTALSVIDISDPSSISTSGRFPLRARDAVSSVALGGDYLYATTTVDDYEGRYGETHRLQVFDVSDAADPARVWVSEDLGAIDHVLALEGVLFVSAGDVGVYIFDVTDPDAPDAQGIVETPGKAGHLTATATALYVAQSAGGIVAIHTGSLPRPESP